jgi:hypothetical protein
MKRGAKMREKKGDEMNAMDRLFAAGRTRIEETGPQSRRTRKIAIADKHDSDHEGGFDNAL